jgi:hypothetical protein
LLPQTNKDLDIKVQNRKLGKDGCGESDKLFPNYFG